MIFSIDYDSYGARSVPLLDATAYESWDPAIPKAQVPGYVSMVIFSIVSVFDCQSLVKSTFHFQHG